MNVSCKTNAHYFFLNIGKLKHENFPCNSDRIKTAVQLTFGSRPTTSLFTHIHIHIYRLLSFSPVMSTSFPDSDSCLPVEKTKTVLFQSPRRCSTRVMLPTASSMADTMPAYDLRELSLMKLYGATQRCGTCSGEWTACSATQRKSGCRTQAGVVGFQLVMCTFSGHNGKY